MKWTYSIKNKMLASFVLLVLCLLVLLSNYNDRQHSKEVKQTINTLYQDRLMAESYLMKLSQCMYKLKEIHSTAQMNSASFKNQSEFLFKQLDTVIDLYSKTVFTKNESTKFALFNAILLPIRDSLQAPNAKKIIMIDKSIQLLNDLSAIQIEESKLILSKSEQLYKAGKLSSDFAFAIIVVILLVLQAIVFAANTFNISKDIKDIHLN